MYFNRRELSGEEKMKQFFLYFGLCLVISGCFIRKPENKEHQTAASEGKKGTPVKKEHGQYWKNRMKLFLADTPKQSPGGIVFLGDSITEGFPLGQYFPGMHVVNRGIGGDRVTGVLDRMEVSVYDLKPVKLFLMIGTNDILWPQSKIKEWTRNYDNLVVKIKEHCPDCAIYAQSILPTSGKFAQHNKTVKRYNAVIKKIAKKRAVNYLDIHSTLVNESGELRSDYTKDGVHLTPAGYMRWVALLEPYIKK